VKSGIEKSLKNTGIMFSELIPITAENSEIYAEMTIYNQILA
jgi:hypothetical protein